MTGKGCFLTFDVGREESSNTPMLVLCMYCLWLSSCSGLLHTELYASKRPLLVRLGKPYGPVARYGQVPTGCRWSFGHMNP